jgi:hypothetical protein
MWALEALLFGVLVRSTNSTALRAVLATATKLTVEDRADVAVAMRRKAAMALLVGSCRELERRLKQTASTQRPKIQRKINQLTQQIRAHTPALEGAVARAALIPAQCHTLCAGVKRVMRLARGAVRLEAAVCLVHMCATDIDAVAVLRGYALQSGRRLAREERLRQYAAIDALLGAHGCGLPDLELLP